MPADDSVYGESNGRTNALTGFLDAGNLALAYNLGADPNFVTCPGELKNNIDWRTGIDVTVRSKQDPGTTDVFRAGCQPLRAEW